MARLTLTEEQARELLAKFQAVLAEVLIAADEVDGDKLGCKGCGSTCGVDGCRICEGKVLCGPCTLFSELTP